MEAITARVKKIELQASSTPVSTKTKKSKTKNGIEGANEEKTKKKKKKHDKERRFNRFIDVDCTKDRK